MPREKNPETLTRKRGARKTEVPPPPSTAETEASAPAFVDPQQRATLIARAAYFRAMERGFAPGNELADWLAAEAEVDAELLQGAPRSAARRLVSNVCQR